MSAKKKRADGKKETITETNHHLKQKARQLAELHKGKKVDRYLLSRC